MFKFPFGNVSYFFEGKGYGVWDDQYLTMVIALYYEMLLNSFDIFIAANNI